MKKNSISHIKREACKPNDLTFSRKYNSRVSLNYRQISITMTTDYNGHMGTQINCSPGVSMYTMFLKKKHHILFLVITSCKWRWVFTILSLSYSKLHKYLWYKLLPRLTNYVGTLPCEIWQFKIIKLCKIKLLFTNSL